MVESGCHLLVNVLDLEIVSLVSTELYYLNLIRNPRCVSLCNLRKNLNLDVKTPVR